MKISQKQASLLAKEIVNQLKQKKVQKCPEHLKKQLGSFLEKRKDLLNKKAEAQDEVNKHDGSLIKIVGKGTKVYPYDSLSAMIDKIEEKAIPSTSEIEDEIILKSMFKSEDDMETFVNSIVKKYEKKLQAKVLVN